MGQYLIFVLFVISPFIIAAILSLMFKRKIPLKNGLPNKYASSVKENNIGEIICGFLELLGEIPIH